MSIELINAAFKSDIKPSARKFVLVALCDYANEVGEAYPSIETLTKKTSQNRKTVIAHLAALAEKGIITDTGERVGKTKQIPKYQIHLETIPKTEQLDTKNSPENKQYRKRDASISNSPKNGTGKPPKSGTVKESQKRDTEPPVLFNHQKEPPEEGASALPDTLNLEAWNKWIDFRRKAKFRKYKTNEMVIALSQLLFEDQARCVNYSVSKEYQGLFPERFTSNPNQKTTKTDYGEMRGSL